MYVQYLEIDLRGLMQCALIRLWKENEQYIKSWKGIDQQIKSGIKVMDKSGLKKQTTMSNAWCVYWSEELLVCEWICMLQSCD